MGDFPTSLFISDLIPYLHIGPIYNLYEPKPSVNERGFGTKSNFACEYSKTITSFAEN